MSPGAPMQHIGNGRARYAKLTRDRGFTHARRSALAYGADALGGETRAVASLSPLARATLAPHIVHVVAVGGEEQVIRPHTRRVIALVTGRHPRRNGTVREFPGHAMSLAWLRMAKRELPVAVGVSPRLPQPTIPRLINLLPEAFRHVPTRAVTSRTQEGAVGSACPLFIWMHLERRRAAFASGNNHKLTTVSVSE